MREILTTEKIVLSNTQIKKLGERIRDVNCQKENCDLEDLIHLQNFRLSFKDSLNEIFRILSEESKLVHKNRIVSFRIKKIDTIFSKLNREKGMDLERMGDIAGCRCIVHSESAIHKIVERLEKNYTLKINDKIGIPGEDGYRALHIYVKSKNCKINRTVEIQLRTFEQHYWSTLVEIIDVVYGTNIKIGDQSIPDLNTFLKIYANKDSLKISEKVELIRLEEKYHIYNQLNATFNKNLINLRMTWENLKDYSNNTYILFDVNQETKEASYNIFDNYEIAEQKYFEKFQNTNGDILVAHLGINNFKQLAAAYSNYVLTNHDFQDSWIDFCTKTADELLDSLEIEDLFPIFHSIKNSLTSSKNALISDLNDIGEQFNLQKIDYNQFLKLKEWMHERATAQEGRIDRFADIIEKLNIKIEKRITKPKNILKSFLKSFLSKN